MRRLFRRALLGGVAAALLVTLSASPVPAGVGTRLVNGDGDTSGKCLSIANTGKSSTVLMEPCNLNAHQGWVVSSDRGFLRITSQDWDAWGKCLTAHPGNGAPVTMEWCNDGGDQFWTVQSQTGSWTQYMTAVFGYYQCIDVRDNGQSNVVQMWGCGPSNKGNQLWKFW